MSEAGASRNERRKAQTSTAILDAAGELFRDRGFQHTTIEAIAQRADVSVGSVYVHFKSKEALYLALTERALDINEQYMRRVQRPELSPLQRVLLAGDAYLSFHLEEPGAFRMIALRVLEPSLDEGLQAIEERIAERVQRLVGAVELDLRGAIERGEVRAIDARRAMTFLWGAWNGVIALSLRQDKLRLDERELIATLEVGRALVLEALASASAKRRLRPWLQAAHGRPRAPSP